MAKLIFFVFILLSVANCKECNRLVPGLEKMQSGIDLSAFNMFTILTPVSNPKFLQPVLKYTCNQNKTFVNPTTQQVYDVPDQISTITMLGGGQLDFTNLLEVFTFDLKAQMAIEMESDSFFGLFSSSSEFDTAYSLSLGQGLMVGQVASQISAYEIQSHLQEAQPSLFNFTEDAFYTVNEVFKNYPVFNETSFSAYEKVFEIFGTHHFSKGGFGGLLRLGWFTSKLYASSSTNEQLTAQAALQFFNFVVDSGGFSGSKKTVDSIFLSSTKFTEKCLGGNGGCPNSPAAWTTWANSVSGNPWLFSGAIQPNFNLIQNTFLRLNMQAATWNHFYRAFLMKEVPLALSVAKAQLPTLVHQEGQCSYSDQVILDSLANCKNNVDPRPIFNNLATTLPAKINSLNTEIDQLTAKANSAIAKSVIIDIQTVMDIGKEFVDILRRVESLPTLMICHFVINDIYLSIPELHLPPMCIPCDKIPGLLAPCKPDYPPNTPARISYPRNL